MDSSVVSGLSGGNRREKLMTIWLGDENFLDEFSPNMVVNVAFISFLPADLEFYSSISCEVLDLNMVRPVTKNNFSTSLI